MTQISADRCPYNPIRHPSESWDIPVGGRDARPIETPAFAGVTGSGGVRSARFFAFAGKQK